MLKQLVKRPAFDPQAALEHLAGLGRSDGKIPNEFADPPIGRMAGAFTHEALRTRRGIMCEFFRIARSMPREWWRSYTSALGTFVFEVIGTEDGPAVTVLSHADSVRNGGKYDGLLGLIAALVIVDQIAITRRPRRTLRVIVCIAEESDFTGVACLDSRFLVGSVDPDTIAKVNYGAVTLAEHLGAERMMRIRTEWNTTKRFSVEDTDLATELHIEQSNLLAALGYDVGVVTHIGGSWREKLSAEVTPMRVESHDHVLARLRFVGKRAHTGAMPPNPRVRGGQLFRKDALVASSLCAKELLRQDSVRLVSSRYLSPSGYTTVPYDQEVVLLVRTDMRDLHELALAAAAVRSQQDFGVVMTYEITPCDAQEIMTIEHRSALRALSVAPAVAHATRSAFAREGVQLGLTRATVTDMVLDEHGLRALLDGREIDHEAGTRLQKQLHGVLEVCSVTVTSVSRSLSTPTDPIESERLFRLAEETVIWDGDVRRPLKVLRIASFPGHDLRPFLEQGIRGVLLFVRQASEEETSHSPRETVEWQDVFRAFRVFALFIRNALHA